jgi:hypothetical protein
MVRIAVAFTAGALLLAAGAPAKAESFRNMKYLGGLSQHRAGQVGSLALDGGELRFEDCKGHVVFALTLGDAKASIGAEKRTTVGSIFRSAALMMVAIPLSAGQVDPTQAWSRDTRPILVVQLAQAAGGTVLRWRGPVAQLRRIAEAINQASVREVVVPTDPS